MKVSTFTEGFKMKVSSFPPRLPPDPAALLTALFIQERGASINLHAFHQSPIWTSAVSTLKFDPFSAAGLHQIKPLFSSTVGPCTFSALWLCIDPQWFFLHSKTTGHNPPRMGLFFTRLHLFLRFCSELQMYSVNWTTEPFLPGDGLMLSIRPSLNDDYLNQKIILTAIHQLTANNSLTSQQWFVRLFWPSFLGSDLFLTLVQISGSPIWWRASLLGIWSSSPPYGQIQAHSLWIHVLWTRLCTDHESVC